MYSNKCVYWNDVQMTHLASNALKGGKPPPNVGKRRHSVRPMMVNRGRGLRAMGCELCAHISFPPLKQNATLKGVKWVELVLD